MGLMPPGSLLENQELSNEQLKGLETGERGLPPMKIRNAAEINKELGRSPLPNGFVSIPVFAHTENSLIDDISFGGCDFVNLVDGYNYPRNETYSDYYYLCNELKPAY
jgi:hypothetical protein